LLVLAACARKRSRAAAMPEGSGRSGDLPVGLAFGLVAAAAGLQAAALAEGSSWAKLAAGPPWSSHEVEVSFGLRWAELHAKLLLDPMRPWAEVPSEPLHELSTLKALITQPGALGLAPRRRQPGLGHVARGAGLDNRAPTDEGYRPLLRAMRLAERCGRAAMALLCLGSLPLVFPYLLSLGRRSPSPRCRVAAVASYMVAAALTFFALAMVASRCLQHAQSLASEALFAFSAGKAAVWPSHLAMTLGQGARASLASASLALAAGLAVVGCPERPTWHAAAVTASRPQAIILQLTQGDGLRTASEKDAEELRRQVLHEAAQARQALFQEHRNWADGLIISSVVAFVVLLFAALGVAGKEAVGLGVKIAMDGPSAIHPGNLKAGTLRRGRNEAMQDFRATTIRGAIKGIIRMDKFSKRVRRDLNYTVGNMSQGNWSTLRRRSTEPTPQAPPLGPLARAQVLLRLAAPRSLRGRLWRRGGGQARLS